MSEVSTLSGIQLTGVKSVYVGYPLILRMAETDTDVARVYFALRGSRYYVEPDTISTLERRSAVVIGETFPLAQTRMGDCYV